MKRTIWKDLPSKETPLTAEELNRIEKNILAVKKEFDTYGITTINGKTGVITKEDILALGIPVEDGRYADHDNIFIGKNQPEQVTDIVL